MLLKVSIFMTQSIAKESAQKVDKFGMIRKKIAADQIEWRTSWKLVIILAIWIAISRQWTFFVIRLVEITGRNLCYTGVHVEGVQQKRFCWMHFCITYQNVVTSLPIPCSLFNSILSSASFFLSFFLSITRYAWMCLWFKAEIYIFRTPDDYDD